MKHIEVKDDRVMIGDEWVPRFLDLPQVLQVKAGETFTVPPEATADYIEVAGTLTISRDHDTALRFTHLIVLPGGHFDCGSDDDPMLRKVDLVVRDVPIDLTRDPFQWGNGFLNFGRVDRCGLKKTAWAILTDSVIKGNTEIIIAGAVQGWNIGDELLIPDTVTPNQRTLEPQREHRLVIAGLASHGADTLVSLNRPVEFDHPKIVNPRGTVILRPRVANLTRNIRVASQNPDGTPGHTVDAGMMAMWCYCYNEIRDLGRTTIDPLDDTVFGTKIGKNQRGKYAAHHHHVGSSPDSMDVGNVYVGRGGNIGAKWGLSLHQTSDIFVHDNIIVDFPGAGFVTEDGYEVRNIVDHNLAAYCLGHARDAQGNVFDAAGNLARNAPGAEGTGFWLHGVMNSFLENEAWNNFTSGFNFMNQSQPVDLYPSVPGGEPDTPLQHFKDKPIAVTGNVAAANVVNGVEIWGVGRARFPYANLISAFNGARNVFPVNSDGIAVYFENAQIIGDVGRGATGMHSSMGYVENFEMVGGEISGCALGISGGGGSSSMYLTDVVLQNEFNIDMLTRDCKFTNVMHLPLGTAPHKYVGFGDGAIWDGTDPLPKVGISLWIPDRGSQIKFINWQGTGKDYLGFYKQSLASNPAWYSSSFEGVHIYNCPVKGLTMQESWDRFGLSYGGDVLKEEDAVQLDGLVNGLARAGLGVQLGPPRAIVTFPTMRTAAIPEGGVIRVAALITGDYTQASEFMALSVDGSEPYYHTKDGTDDRLFTTDHLSPGTHTVEVWRTKKDSPLEELPGTRYKSQFFLGDAPPPPPPPVTAVLPSVVGLTHAAAVSAVTAVGLLASVTMQQSAAVPAGIIISQAPPTGAVVTLGSNVSLIESSGAPPPAPDVLPPGTYALTDRVGHKVTITVT